MAGVCVCVCGKRQQSINIFTEAAQTQMNPMKLLIYLLLVTHLLSRSPQHSVLFVRKAAAQLGQAPLNPEDPADQQPK